MKKKFRVKKNHEFEYIINSRDRYADYYFIIYKKSTTNPYPRIGISVGKKLGNAVERNKYKRQIRSIIQKNLSKIAPNNDYILITKSNLKNLEYQVIEKNLEKALKKAKILSEV